MPSAPEATTASPDDHVRQVRDELQLRAADPSSTPDDHAAGPAALDRRAAAAAAGSISSCTRAACAAGRPTTRPTMPLGAMTAMSVCTPSPLPRLTVTRQDARDWGCRRSPRRRRVGSAVLCCRSSSCCSCCGPRGERALLLQPDLQVGQLPFQRLVLGARAAQRRRSCPRCSAPTSTTAASRQLDARKHAERHRLEHRHAGTRLDLRRDEDEMPDQHEHEEHTGALAERLSPLKFQHVASYQLPATS